MILGIIIYSLGVLIIAILFLIIGYFLALKFR